MSDWLYRFVRAGLQDFIWGGELTGAENLPEKGPAIFVGNHLGALGPIAAAACLPRRLYPWVASEMLDAKLAPEYLRLDFVEKVLHLRPPLSLWLAKVIAKISVPLLNSVGCVAVYRDAEGLRATFEHSLELLMNGHFLLVFPENPTQPIDPHLKMSPFKKGFVRLGELFFERTQQIISFYPVVVHEQLRLVQVGKPIAYNPYTAPVEERIRVKGVLEKLIQEMYLKMDSGGYIGIPQPR
jgi:1-acyl-sn-glycerol-3-phosphate acyltransferase